MSKVAILGIIGVRDVADRGKHGIRLSPSESIPSVNMSQFDPVLSNLIRYSSRADFHTRARTLEEARQLGPELPKEEVLPALGSLPEPRGVLPPDVHPPDAVLTAVPRVLDAGVYPGWCRRRCTRTGYTRAG